MKDSFQTLDDRDETRRVVEDIAAVRAMAHPLRAALLHYLLSGPPRTATECSHDVGGTPSACSYHLRELARFGLVERGESTGDGRTRPWRAVSVGYSFSAGDQDNSPAGIAADAALTGAGLVEHERLLRRFFEAGDGVAAEWRAASDLHTYELTLTAAELVDLRSKVDAVLAQYRTPVRNNPPDDAVAVHVAFHAFPRIARS